jgi:hypothetical protein
MTRISKTFLLSSFLAVVGMAACDPSEAGPDEPRIGNFDLDLDLDIEQQLEDHVDADLECSEWPEPGEVLDESVDEVIAPCLEWTEVGSDLDLRGPQDQIPTGYCSYWEESDWVGTNVKCGEDGHLILSYKRDCSQCPPGPVTCSGYRFSHTLCNCTIC